MFRVEILDIMYNVHVVILLFKFYQNRLNRLYWLSKIEIYQYQCPLASCNRLYGPAEIENRLMPDFKRDCHCPSDNAAKVLVQLYDQLILVCNNNRY